MNSEELQLRVKAFAWEILWTDQHGGAGGVFQQTAVSYTEYRQVAKSILCLYWNRRLLWGHYGKADYSVVHIWGFLAWISISFSDPDFFIFIYWGLRAVAPARCWSLVDPIGQHPGSKAEAVLFHTEDM